MTAADHLSFYRGRRVLITGGAGFIGSNLARRLVDLGADVLLVDALLADYGGNLEYAMTSRNFNPLMAMAGAVTIAEAEDIVPIGAIAPDAVVTPGVIVHYLVGRASA